MNPNKTVKPLTIIFKDAMSCEDLYSSIKKNVSELRDMRIHSRKIRNAYVLLTSAKTLLLQDKTPIQKVLNCINKNGELEHAIGVAIPPITKENKYQVIKDIVAGIDHTVETLISRLSNFSVQHSEAVKELINSYQRLAVNQKSILCDLRQYVSAVDYNEQMKLENTTICGCSKDNFSSRISALKTLHRSLVSPWDDWSQTGLNSAMNRFGYKLLIETSDDLDPEEQPEEPLEPEVTVVPKEGVKEGSDNPIPDSEVDPSRATSSVEAPTTDTVHNLGWSRRLMLDGINSLIAAVDRMKELAPCNENLSKSIEALGNIPEMSSEFRGYEKTVLKNRTYSSMCSSVLTIYGREVNRLVNNVINMVVHSCEHLDK